MTTTHLKKKVFASSLWSFVGSGGRQLSGLIVFIVLTRLLMPSDFGIIAMAVAFVEVLNMLVRLGLATEIVRRESFTETDRATAFWLSLGAGITASFGLYFFSKPIATMLGVPEVAHVLTYLCIIPALTSLTTVHEALLQKDFNYKALAMRTLLSNLGAGGIAIILAFRGWGFYSLVFQSIASLLITNLMLWSLVRWYPSFRFSLASARSQLTMGIPQMGYTLLNVVSGRSVDIIVGLFLGTTAVGYMRIAAKLQDFLVQFTIDPVVTVALPTFSKLQNNLAALGRAYRSFTQLCGLLTFPAFLGLGAIAPIAISLVFGDHWQPSGTLMQILCIASVGTTINYFFKPAMLAIGKPHEIFYINLCQTVVQVSLIFLGAQFSIYMAVLGLTVASWVFLGVTQQVLKTHIGLSPASVLQALVPPLVSATLMASAILLWRHMFWIPSNPVAQLILFGTLGAILYAGILLIAFRPYLQDIQQKVLPTILTTTNGKLGFLRKLNRLLPQKAT